MRRSELSPEEDASPYQKRRPSGVHDTETEAGANTSPQIKNPFTFRRFSMDMLPFSSFASNGDGGRMGVCSYFFRCPRGKKAWLAFVALMGVSLAIGFWMKPLPIHTSGGQSSVGGNSNSVDTCGQHNVNEIEMERLKNLSSVSNVPNAAVATDHPTCSKVGLSILQDFNGNAVDAAIASALCLGVVNPASSGMGGGGFMLIHMDPKKKKNKQTNSISSSETNNIESDDTEINVSSDQKGEEENNNIKITEFIDAREVAPSASTYDMFESLPSKASLEGPLAIGVWGELRGLFLAHSRHGSVPWKDLVEPSMILARDGVKVTKELAKEILDVKSKISKFDTLRQLLSNATTGSLLVEGETLVQPVLAETLADIANHGADVLYKGERARQMVSEIQKLGGIITEEDLANYKPLLRTPLVTHISSLGYTLVGAPPPSSGGGVVMGIVRFLSGYMLSNVVLRQETLTKHRMVEAMKHAFALRMSLSDPAFETGKHANASAKVISDLISGDYMEFLRRDHTNDDAVMPLHVYGGPKWSQLTDGDGQNADDANKTDYIGWRRRAMHKQQEGKGAVSEGGDASNQKRNVRNNRQSHRQTRLWNYLEDHGTSHLSIVDKNRNAVAFTSTVNTQFGSGILSSATGIYFNNQASQMTTIILVKCCINTTPIG